MPLSLISETYTPETEPRGPRFDRTYPLEPPFNLQDTSAFTAGQRVANMQLEAAYRQILTRFPQARWTGNGEIAPNNFVHAISRLEVNLGPEA